MKYAVFCTGRLKSTLKALLAINLMIRRKTIDLIRQPGSTKNAILTIPQNGRSPTEATAMADNKLARRQTGLLTQHGLLSNESKIAIALGEMAIKRGTEMSPVTQELFAAGLSTEKFDDVLAVIQRIAGSPRREHEPACPDFGTILLAVRSLNHPQRRLREIVTALARIFGITADEEFLALYEAEAGHRTDEDLEKAFGVLRGDESLRRMPTPAQLRGACGIPRVYRDGKVPD